MTNPALAKAMASLAAAVPRAEADPTRPVYHFRPAAYWSNDPNGPIWYKGYYHLFYQHNPYGDNWGEMHWGHARSRDLVHWERLPIALWPSKEKGEDHCFSGGAVVDPRGQPMLFYTIIGNRLPEQWAAVPLDEDLVTWDKHPANPVVTEAAHGDVKIYEWRDPFVVEHEGRYYMVAGGNLNESKGGQAVVNLYQAINDELTQWRYLGVLFQHPDASAANIECPNFFKLNGKWVVVVSPHRAPEYFVGSFDVDTHKFTWQSRGVLDYGNYYAPNCLLDHKGRRIMWGWVTGFPAGRGWNGCMTLPRVLTLQPDGGIRQHPAPELAALRGTQWKYEGFALRGGRVIDDIRGDTMEILARFELGDAKAVGLRVRRSEDGKNAVTIRYDGAALEVAGTKAPLKLADGQRILTLHIFLDKSAIEAYANDGDVCVTRVVYPGEADLGIEVFAEGGLARVAGLQAWEMKPIW